jgi:tRNA dimethylallyltransferase
MKYLIVIAGPTAVGKTKVGIRLAKKLNTEIVSADSRQIFKELTIGTAVPTCKELSAVRHHFIQNKSIFDYYNASKYEYEVLDLLKNLFQTYDIILMVGGSGLYIDAVCRGIDDLPEINPETRAFYQKKYEEEGIEGLRRELKLIDPAYYKEVDLRNHTRILRALEVFAMTNRKYSELRTGPQKKRFFKILKLGLNMSREALHENIEKRVDSMMEKGLIDESKKWFEHRNLNTLNTVGYKELFDYFDDKHSLDSAVELIKRNTRRYARRQISWFKRDKSLPWFHPNDFDGILKEIEMSIKEKK